MQNSLDNYNKKWDMAQTKLENVMTLVIIYL